MYVPCLKYFFLQELEFYGVVFDCPEPVYDNPDIVVHPLLQPDQDILCDIMRMAELHTETPFEVQTYIDICRYLSEI